MKNTKNNSQFCILFIFLKSCFKLCRHCFQKRQFLSYGQEKPGALYLQVSYIPVFDNFIFIPQPPVGYYYILGVKYNDLYFKSFILLIHALPFFSHSGLRIIFCEYTVFTKKILRKILLSLIVIQIV